MRVKLVLEGTLVYWLSLERIPKGILKGIRKIIFTLLWSGNHQRRISLISWKDLALPKKKGGWGLRNMYFFVEALAAKSCWRMIFNQGCGGM